MQSMRPAPEGTNKKGAAAADRCDGTGAADAAEAKHAEHAPGA